MIRYVYNLETDPEPPPTVRRLNCWHSDDGTHGCRCGHTHRWVRRPCRQRGYHNHRWVMDREECRWARRNGKFYVTKHGRRQHLPATVRFRWAWSCVRATGGAGHYHWHDGDKSHAWGPLRGCNRAADADAFRRLHTMTRRRRHGR